MSQSKPKMATIAEINRILKSVAKERDLPRRIETISAQFLNHPYLTNPLIGGLDTPEALLITLDGFDCVTYMETVLALSLAETAKQFKENLIRVRYHNGEIDWQKRHHYTSDWWRANQQLGVIENLARGREAVAKTRELNLVQGLAARRVRFSIFPKKSYRRIEKLIRTGDLVCFGSTKKSLDVFHTGILIRRDDKILLRHASRTAGSVIDQDVADFLKTNRMSGFVLLRPTKNNS